MAPILADTDITTATIVSVGALSVPPHVVWRGFAEREVLEQWYGPTDEPAHFENHELRARTRSLYRVADRDGSERLGYLQFIAVETDRRLIFTDGKRTESGDFGPEFLHAVVELEPTSSGTRMFVTQSFADRNDMEQLMLSQLEAVVSTLS
ncbi:SRPBCC domain-containing protein [Gryllotalpicola reticulitermitis]|uniref:SRPBCC domain-containing protein n=1 Tax=Gryllotalpicola reticulitermitis TaxID=1184153 RepID=A0ABV8Q5D4_9MICO